MRRIVITLPLIAGCGRAEGPIVVWWTLETLGATAAEQSGWCAALTEDAAAHGLPTTCLEGAIAPGTWTLESHVRFLFPEHLAGTLRVAQRPDPTARSVLARIAADHGGTYVFASDNPVFDLWGVLESGNGTVWTGGADRVVIADGVQASVIDAPEDRPTGLIVDELGAVMRHEGAVTAYLNAFDAGGHVPRCVQGIGDPRCAAAWDLAVAYGLAEPGADPASAMLSSALWVDLLPTYAEDQGDTDPTGVRRTTFDTTLASIDGGGLTALRTTLDRLLSDVERANRQDDLVLILAGDHGDAPCVRHPLIEDQYICEHDQAPTEWHAAVPVFVIGAAEAVDRWRAAGWVADDGTPWALSNLAYGLMEAVGQPAPSIWPEPLPAGTAESWSCEPEGTGGVRIEGDDAEWCDHNTCVRGPWRMPDLGDMTSGTDDAREAGPTEWTGWFDTWCLPGGPL